MRAWELNEIEEDLKARNVIGSAVRVDEIPPKYREKYEMIGRGATTLVYAMDEDWVLLFTRDKMKEEWLGYMGLELGQSVDQLEVRGIQRIRGMDEIPIYVIKMPRLYNLSPQNKRIVKQEIEQFNDIWQEIRQKYMYKVENNEALVEIYQYYGENLEDSLLYPLLNFVANYKLSQFFFDLLNRNFMQDAQGDIVIIDPIVDADVYNLIMDSKK